jgi:pyruvate dehydrogenase E1 component
VYELRSASGGDPAKRPQLLASGVGVAWVLEAQELLRNDFGVEADVWSVTSWNELRRDGLGCDSWAFNHPGEQRPAPYVAQALSGRGGPVVAVSDWMRAVPDQIRQYVPNEFVSLGADGFGLSDTRAAARRHFHIDGPSVAYQALRMLAARGEVDAGAPAQAYERYKLDDVRAGTSGNAGGES